jgi:starch synthase (maltosyl-transferring)
MSVQSDYFMGRSPRDVALSSRRSVIGIEQMRKMEPGEDWRRVVIEGVQPEIEGGRYPAKRTVGEKLVVEGDIFTDGHDAISGVLLYRKEGARRWSEVPLEFLVNDRWRGEFEVTELGRYVYTLEAWVDPFRTWRGDLRKKVDAGQDVAVDLEIGAELIRQASSRAPGEDKKRLESSATTLKRRGSAGTKVDLALGEELLDLMGRYPNRGSATRYEKELSVVVDRERARCGAWYEMFPRSCAPQPGQHGTFRDCEKRLPYIAEMGFDVLYLPPIHPIGRTHRKGKNNSPKARRNDPGSPWAIGAREGGHKSVHPKLGTLKDFRRLIEKAKDHGIEIALDIAFQCSPDHPYIREHPEWFRLRPDGSVQYAENPPKKYEDIYPLQFETAHWRELWEELKSVILFWIDQGVRIFRVDNPHTKPLTFWEWLIDEVKRDNPEVIFLSEAFTRPKIMYRLAKVGFAQSYTYFAWRNTKWELTEYFTELTQTEVRDYFRPNLWPNTSDILNEYLQLGGRPAFMTRFILAATLGGSYGIYGPAFELCENRPRGPGSEEYLNSEKYELRHWDLDSADSLRELIARVNRIRRDNPALQSDKSLRFHHVDNEQMICYSKRTEDFSNAIIVVVNLEPHYAQSGWVELNLDEFGLNHHRPYQVHDLLTDARYLWDGPRNYVQLNPHEMPAHIFRVRRRIRSEQDFEYFL